MDKEQLKKKTRGLLLHMHTHTAFVSGTRINFSDTKKKKKEGIKKHSQQQINGEHCFN